MIFRVWNKRKMFLNKVEFLDRLQGTKTLEPSSKIALLGIDS